MTTKASEIVKTSPKATREFSPWEDVDRVFDTLFHRGWLSPFNELFPEWRMFDEKQHDLRMPRVDMVDEEGAIVVRAEVPGVDKENLEVNLSGQMLTIKGESHNEEEERKGEYYRSEIASGTFSRTLRLPEEVEDRKVKAEFRNGVLEIRLPKAHKVQRQRIAVE